MVAGADPNGQWFRRLAFLAALIGFVLMMRVGLRFARTWQGSAVLAGVAAGRVFSGAAW